MSFINIQNKVRQLETSKRKNRTSAALQSIFNEHGHSIIADEQTLFSLIDNAEFPEVSKLRVKLVFSCVAVRNYLSGDTIDLKMTQINNLLHVICSTTGLTYIVAVETLSDILCALGLNCTITYSPVLEGDKIKNEIHTVMPVDIAVVETARIRKDFEIVEKQSGNISEEEGKALLEDIKRLCSAGIPDGFYLLSKCYQYGYLNTAINLAKAEEYIKLAADAGSSDAASSLADKYYHNDNFMKRSFEEAFYYYTKPGSVSLKTNQQMNVIDIYKQKKENKLTLIFLCISTILFAVFIALFNKGMFSDSSRLIPGIIILLISILHVAGVFVYYFKKSKYNSIRNTLFLQYLIWTIYVIILELA